MTVKDLSSITNRKSGIIENNHRILVNTAYNTIVLSSKASEALQKHLDTLPEDCFEDHPFTTPSQACLPAPEVNPHIMAKYTIPSSAESQNPMKNIGSNSLATASYNQSFEVEHIPVLSSRSQESTKSVKVNSENTTDISPATGIRDSNILPTF